MRAILRECTEEINNLSLACAGLLGLLFAKKQSPHDSMLWSHDSMLQRMQAMGYPIDRTGHCLGIASMAMQASLMGELDQFNARLERIASIPVHEFKKYMEDTNPDPKNLNKASLQKLKERLDVQAFFDGVLLYQQTHVPKGILPKTLSNAYNMGRQQTDEVMPLVLPDTLKPVKMLDNVGAYNKKELEQSLGLLCAVIPPGVRTSLILRIDTHAIHLSFDPSKNCFTLIDANNLPAKIFSATQQGQSELANRIFQQFIGCK
jgi:hypothetical protein